MNSGKADVGGNNPLNVSKAHSGKKDEDGATHGDGNGLFGFIIISANH